jgi:Icc-related predicted phosphoesterase
MMHKAKERIESQLYDMYFDIQVLRQHHRSGYGSPPISTLIIKYAEGSPLVSTLIIKYAERISAYGHIHKDAVYHAHRKNLETLIAAEGLPLDSSSDAFPLPRDRHSSE